MAATTSSQRSRLLLPALCAIAISGQIGSFLYLPALPAIAREFAVGEAAVQATLTTYLIGTCLGFALYGPLSDRLGQRPMLALATVLFVLASLACWIAPDLETLLFWRFVQGLGSTAGVITARATIRGTFRPPEDARAMAHLSAGMALAPAMSPLLGSLVLDLVDWRATFLVAALVATGSTALALKVVSPGATGAAGNLWRSFAVLFASPTFRGCVLLAAAAHSMLMVMMAGSPFVFIATLGLSPLAYGVLMAVILFGFAVVAARAGRLIGRIGPRRAMSRGVGPMAAGAAGMVLVSLLAPSAATIAAALFVTVAAMGVVMPSLHLALLEPFPALAGTAASTTLLISTLAGAGAVSLFGVVAAGSVAGFALFLASLVGIAVAGWAGLRRTAPATVGAAP